MSTAPDAGAMARMVARPGMDTRVWLTLAIVTKVSYDAAHGIFADVQFQPGGEPETALVGAAYAGGEFGLYCPIDVNDTVLVALPMGDPGNGPVIIARMWAAADKPSAEFGSGEVATDNVVLRMRPGKKFRVITSDSGDGFEVDVGGDGNITLKVNSGVVNLGGADLLPTQGVVNGQAIDTFTGLTQFALGNASSKVLAKKT